MNFNTTKLRLIWVFLGLSLAGCTALAPQPTAAPVVETAQPLPVVPAVHLATPAPARPTATAVVFQMRDTSTPIPTRTPVPTVLTSAYGPRGFPINISPLTGKEVSDFEVMNRRAVVVKITNFPRSVRPQWGLNTADHVFEYYLEDGLTRFAGIFYSQDGERIGPVRSGRKFDEHIVRMYKAIFVFGAADPKVLKPWVDSDLRNFLVIERPDNCPPLCRFGSMWNYNNLFVNTQQLMDYINDRGTNNERQNLDGLRFESVTPYSDQVVDKVFIRFSSTSHNYWQYDAESGRYLRFQETQNAAIDQESYAPLMDTPTDSQVAADNVVVLYLKHDYFYQSSTTEIYIMGFIGKGDAYAFRDGKAYPLIWTRSEQDGLIMLEHPNGWPYSLKPGNVWYEVIGKSSTMEQLSDTSLRFLFDIP